MAATAATAAVMEAAMEWVERQVSTMVDTRLWVAVAAWFLVLQPFIKVERDVLDAVEHQVRIAQHVGSVATPAAVEVTCAMSDLEGVSMCRTRLSGTSAMAVILVLSDAGEISPSFASVACCPYWYCSRCFCGGFASLTE